MKSIICLLAAAILILPAWGYAAEKKDIHAVMTAEEGTAAPARQERGEESLDEEMDDLSDESLAEKNANGEIVPEPREDPTREKNAEAVDVRMAPAATEKIGHGYGTGEPLSANGPVHETVYAELTAIDPVTLKDGDWAFIEGDERRGWFFDRSRMARNEDGSISYWQLILYNDLGRDQFVHAMHDEAYKKLGYTMQRRVLDLKENTIRTYEIIAYDDENMVITDGDRDGHAAEIRPNTMAAKERDAVKKAAKKLKYKKAKG